MAISPHIADPTDQGEKQLVAWLEEQMRKADQVRRAFEPDWYTNCLFLAGKQWEQAHEDVRRFRKIPIRPPETKVRVCINHLISLQRQAVSAIVQNLGQQVAFPSTSDEDDVQRALLETDLLKYRYFEDDEEEVRLHDLIWCMTCGRSARKTIYDPHAETQLLLGRYKAGDVSTTHRSPFQFWISPWTDCMCEPTYIIEAVAMDVDQINDLYPGHDVQSEKVASVTKFLDKLLTSIVDQKVSPPERAKSAVLKTIYIAATVKRPKGRMYVWCNGKLLSGTDLELPDGYIPYTFIDWFQIPGSTYPLAFLTPLRDPQIHSNITYSQLIEFKNRSLRGDVAIRGVGGVHQDFLPSGAKVIKIDPGIQEMQILDYKADVSESERLLARFWNEEMQLAGIHEPSTGQGPAKVATATQLQILKEADLSGLTLFRTGFDRSYNKVGTQKCVIVEEHYKLDRLINTLGSETQMRSRVIRGTDIRGTHDIRTRSVPMMSEAVQMQARRETAIAGLCGPYASPDDQLAKLLALMDTPIPDIMERVQRLLLPYKSIEELFEVVGQLNTKKHQLMAASIDAQMKQLAVGTAVQEAQAEQMMQGGDQSAPPNPGEEAVASMMG